MDACCIHYERVRDVKLVSFESWKTLPDAAKKRKHQKLLEVAWKKAKCVNTVIL